MSADIPEPESRAPPEPAPTRHLGETHQQPYLAVGQVLGDRYEIRTFLGRGGMGEVWHAFDLKLRVEVALKALRPDFFTDQSRRELLRQEVRAAREVVSPNVCRIFDLIEVAGQELVSMEYVDGTTLLDVLQQRGPLELKEAQEIAAQFLSGLEAIHQAGLVHRDVKPENIMLTRTDRVVLMDFGLARQQAEGSGTVAGTPAYMAPEQARGEAVDARADVCAAGVVLAEMISPAGVKDSESRQSVWQGIRQEPVQVPDSPWAPVLEKAVAREKENRYATAHALIRALEEVTLRVEKAEDLNPYPGLASFTEEDAEYFFGREVEIEAMWKKIPRLQMLAVIGPSGAGKTSFLRAGLIPTRPEGWGHLICTPGSSPLLALRRTLVPELAGDTAALQDLMQEENVEAIISAISNWRHRHGQGLLIVDQFEELFTLNTPTSQARFANLLGRIALEADVHVLLSMRDDFLYHCHAHEALQPILADLTLLSPPTGVALRRAVVQPATKCGYQFEDDALVEEMLAEVEGERGALPLLAFAMARLWECRECEQGLLTRQAYGEIGGVGGALARHAETTLERIGRARHAVVRELFRNLVISQGTRAARDRNELLSVFSEAERDVAADVLGELVDARLLTSYEVQAEEDARHQWIEIIHESLLASWPRLIRWQTQDADAAQLRDQLRQSAQVWEEKGRSQDLLWTGSSYREFKVWQERYPGGLSATEEAFARAMTELAGRRRRRRRLAVTGAFIALLAILAVVGSLWRQSVADEQRAEAARLLAIAQRVTETNRVTALAYTITSLELADTQESRLLALKLLWMGPTALTIPHHLDDLRGAWGAAFSPDGRWLAVGHSERDVFVWPADGGPPIHLNSGRSNDGFSFGIAWDPSSKYFVASNSPEGAVRFWSIPEGRLLHRIQFPSRTRCLFRDYGQRMITATYLGKPITSLMFHYLEPPNGNLIEIGQLDTRSQYFDIHPDGSSLVLPAGYEVLLYPLQDFSPDVNTRLSVHDTLAAATTFDPSGRYVATVDFAGFLSLWDAGLPGGEPLREFTIPSGRCVFDSSGSLLATLGWEDVFSTYAVRIWDLDAPPDADPILLAPEKYQTNDGGFNPSGEWFVNTATNATLWNMTTPRSHVLRGHENWVDGMEFTKDGKFLVTGSHDATVRIWPLSFVAGENSEIIYRPPPSLECWTVTEIGVDPQGEFVVVAGCGPLRVVPLAGGQASPLEGIGGVVFDMAIDRQGRFVAAAGGAHHSDEAVIRIWDLNSGVTFALDAGDSLRSHDILFTPEGQVLASGDFGLRLWDLETSKYELLRDAPTRKIALSEDGNVVACVGRVISNRGTLHIHNRQEHTWQELMNFGNQNFVLALDSNGSIVISGDYQGVIRVGQVTGGDPHLLVGHEEAIAVVRVSPDGQWIASSSNDMTVRLWPIPDLSQPHLHYSSHAEFLQTLKALTNIRMVPDETSDTGYREHIAPFPGWEKVPTW